MSDGSELDDLGVPSRLIDERVAASIGQMNQSAQALERARREIPGFTGYENSISQLLQTDRGVQALAAAGEPFEALQLAYVRARQKGPTPSDAAWNEPVQRPADQSPQPTRRDDFQGRLSREAREARF